MAEAAKAVGAPRPIRFRSKQYPLAPYSIEMIGLFEAWMEDRAFRAAERSKASLPSDVYRERVEAVVRQIAAGELAFGSKAFVLASQSLAGIKYSVLLQLQAGSPNSPEIDEKFVDELFREEQDQILSVMQAVNAVDPTVPPEEKPLGVNISA